MLFTLYSPYLRYYQPILPTKQSSGWYYHRSGRSMYPSCLKISSGAGPLGHSRNFGDILFYFCRTTPLTAPERGSTFSISVLSLVPNHGRRRLTVLIDQSLPATCQCCVIAGQGSTTKIQSSLWSKPGKTKKG